MQASGADRGGLLKSPIVASLLLSAALHLCVLLIVQSHPARPGPRTVIISARLVQASTPIPAVRVPPVTVPEPVSKPLPVAMTTTQALPAPPVQPSALPVETAPPAGPPPPAPTMAAPRQELPSLALGVDSTWYQARQVDMQPRAMGKIDPVYPDDARLLGTEGTLKLKLRIDDLGRVLDAEVVEANPPGVFDRAALEAFRNAHFQPAMREGRPVRIEAYYRVDFKLER